MKYLLAFLAFVFLSSTAYAETSFDRVLKDRTIRCSYASLAPFMIIDANTQEKSGIFPEIMTEIGQRLDLDIDWVEEVSYPQIATGLQTKRYDAFCGTLWATPARASSMTFTKPLYYQAVHACVADKNTAYDNSVEALNSADKKLMAYDGDVSMQLTKALFPKAEITTIPDMMSFAEAMQWISTGKVDAVATCNKLIMEDFNKNADKKVKLANPSTPLTYVMAPIGVGLNETALSDMLSVAIFDMQMDGTLDRILSKYMTDYEDEMIIPKVK